VFLVVWNIFNEDIGLKGLEFWFRFLAAHLASQPSNHSRNDPESADNVHYSVMVMGTHLNHPSLTKGIQEKEKRATIVD